MNNFPKGYFFKFFLLFVFSAFSYSYAEGQICKENLADEKDHATCAMETVTFPKTATSEITGLVVFNGMPFENAIVEIYKTSKGKSELVKKYKTLKDGRFCFLELPKGKYRLRTSTTEFAFKCTEMEVEIKGKTKRLIKLPIEVGN